MKAEVVIRLTDDKGSREYPIVASEVDMEGTFADAAVLLADMLAGGALVMRRKALAAVLEQGVRA